MGASSGVSNLSSAYRKREWVRKKEGLRYDSRPEGAIFPGPERVTERGLEALQ